MSELDKLLSKLPKDFKLNLEVMPKIIELEKKYNAIGSKVLNRLMELAHVTPSGGEQSFFILGYSECGQNMDAEIQKLKAAVTLQNEMLSTLEKGHPEARTKKYRQQKKELEKLNEPA